ncbi:helix-turn-helix domain-containing protein, partial [Vibrio sp. D173a]|uniref:helix-turn-helix transcriptional regulator n=1 Tax=Vibrio sp. D173a TaxID=2836349 RepID=UPI0025541376
NKLGVKIMATLIRTLLMMSLAKRLITLRKEKGLTQQQMADVLSVHVNSLKNMNVALVTSCFTARGYQSDA